MIFAEDPNIKAVKLKQSASRYVNERGRRQAFIVEGNKEHGFEEVKAIDRTDKGVMLISEQGFDKISRVIEVMDHDIDAIFYEDE